jgi:pimeloyl-ACP methyl ester carboxylesterase
VDPGQGESWPRQCRRAGEDPYRGSDQWVLERSEDVGNPVVLFLHGGPGISQLMSNRRDTRGLEKYFTVVNWDQRGAGKSYGAIHDPDRMNIGQFVADTRELTVYLLKKFHQDRLVLVGLPRHASSNPAGPELRQISDSAVLVHVDLDD